MTESKHLGKSPIKPSEIQNRLFGSSHKTKDYYEQALIFTIRQRDDAYKSLLEAAEVFDLFIDAIQDDRRHKDWIPAFKIVAKRLRASAGVEGEEK